jgi:hypothetical protein
MKTMVEACDDLRAELAELRRVYIHSGGVTFLLGVWVGVSVMAIVWGLS